MLVAVLDTNFWLATHVVVVTLGYAATFLAGFLAIVYILRGLFSQGLNPTTAKSLSRMVYGIICFATLFSFVGTVLGGIWADQSWGRFWGWDPKENGALMIVIWNAAVLHARWGGIIRERGLMLMAVFGNIVTSFSWFGVNMLGVGLHNYGFMDQAFKWLMIFDASQLLLLSLALIPLRHWKSFRTPSK
jgi:ABC-type transport system involved in cytochrome c biogenesis permease subunit